MGLQDVKLSEKLQIDSTKSHASINHKQSEAERVVKKQQGVLRRGASPASPETDEAKGKRDQRPRDPQYKKQTKCMRSGSAMENHLRLKCPARDDTCVRCYKRGHFVKVCLSTPKKFGAIAADDPEEQDEIDSDDDGFFLEGIENWKHSSENESLEWRGQSEWRDD